MTIGGSIAKIRRFIEIEFEANLFWSGLELSFGNGKRL